MKSVLNKDQNRYYYNIFLEKGSNIRRIFFDNLIMLEFGKKIVAKEKLYSAKKPISIWDVDVDIILISNLIETNNNSNYLIGYLDEVIKPRILSKMNGYIKTYKDKYGNKDNKLIFFRIDDENLFKICKAICTKIEDLKTIKLTVISVFDDRYIKNKIITYGDKFDTNFRGLMV